MTINEIKKQLTDEFMASVDVREKWQLKEGEDFEDVFKTSSVENLIFYIVASIIYLREKVQSLWLKDVEQTALATRYGTKQWWWKMALMWQDGESVEIKDNGQIGYEEEDEEKRLIKYAAVVSEGRAVYIRVAKVVNDELAALSGDELGRFQDYIEDIKPLGIMAIGQSFEACKINITATVYYDGERLSSEVESACKMAINEYFNSIAFGGIVFKNKITDAVQGVEGVSDITLGSITYDDNGRTGTLGRYYQAEAGYYKADITLNMTIENAKNQ